jgi:hypothetical protein
MVSSDTPFHPMWGVSRVCVWCGEGRGVGRCNMWEVGGGEGRSVLALGCGVVGSGVWEGVGGRGEWGVEG